MSELERWIESVKYVRAEICQKIRKTPRCQYSSPQCINLRRANALMIELIDVLESLEEGGVRSANLIYKRLSPNQF